MASEGIYLKFNSSTLPSGDRPILSVNTNSYEFHLMYDAENNYIYLKYYQGVKRLENSDLYDLGEGNIRITKESLLYFRVEPSTGALKLEYKENSESKADIRYFYPGQKSGVGTNENFSPDSLKLIKEAGEEWSVITADDFIGSNETISSEIESSSSSKTQKEESETSEKTDEIESHENKGKEESAATVMSSTREIYKDNESGKTYEPFLLAGVVIVIVAVVSAFIVTKIKQLSKIHKSASFEKAPLSYIHREKRCGKVTDEVFINVKNESQVYCEFPMLKNVDKCINVRRYAFRNIIDSTELYYNSQIPKKQLLVCGFKNINLPFSCAFGFGKNNQTNRLELLILTIKNYNEKAVIRTYDQSGLAISDIYFGNAFSKADNSSERNMNMYLFQYMVNKCSDGALVGVRSDRLQSMQHLYSQIVQIKEFDEKNSTIDNIRDIFKLLMNMYGLIVNGKPVNEMDINKIDNHLNDILEAKETCTSPDVSSDEIKFRSSDTSQIIPVYRRSNTDIFFSEASLKDTTSVTKTNSSVLKDLTDNSSFSIKNKTASVLSHKPGLFLSRTETVVVNAKEEGLLYSDLVENIKENNGYSYYKISTISDIGGPDAPVELERQDDLRFKDKMMFTYFPDVGLMPNPYMFENGIIDPMRAKKVIRCFDVRGDYNKNDQIIINRIIPAQIKTGMVVEIAEKGTIITK